MRVLSIMFVLLLVTVAQAQRPERWKHVSTSQDGSRYYVDTASLKREGTHATVQVMSVKYHIRYHSKFTADCITNRFWWEQRIAVAPDKTSVGFEDIKGFARLGTPLGSVLNYACSNLDKVYARR